MAGSNIMTEQFEDADELYFWIDDNFKGNRPEHERHISRSFFTNRIENYRELSTDWDIKTTPPRNPHETRARKGNPEKYGVLFFVIRDIRPLDVTILYTPNQNNPAHSDICCDSTLTLSQITQLARKIREKADWKIYYNEPVMQQNHVELVNIDEIEFSE